ncbi:hypothetical protein AVEN_204325-1 [Araneus ventricosus]|uniref:Uncharacterized protein n=1 Tax=Araneus ventricosus TaxID=182803 RepID=A0A4Y2UNE7_ARAVE|nr:hypothetical protein AVEN_204325-1 [Araneus ventricosus]
MIIPEIKKWNVSLVTLMSRYEGTRGLFWDGPRNFKHRSGDEDDIWAGTCFSERPHHTSGRTFGPRYYLECNRPNTRRLFSAIGIEPGNPPAPKPTSYH